MPRMLVQLDGRRFTPSTLDAYVDLNNRPIPLVSRVELVTGGASSTWGSESVSGVANFVRDKGFEGIKGGVNHGSSTQVDDACDHDLVGGVEHPGINVNRVPSVFHIDAYVGFTPDNLGERMKGREVYPTCLELPCGWVFASSSDRHGPGGTLVPSACA